MLIAVVDSRPVVREGLLHALADGNEVSASSSYEELNALGVLPDVVVDGTGGESPPRYTHAVTVRILAGSRPPSPIDPMRLGDLQAARTLKDWSRLAAAAQAKLTSEDTLTPRQRDVLMHVRQGRSAREIAEAMGLSVKTVENHKLAVYAKLGIQSREEAAGSGAQFVIPGSQPDRTRG